MQGVSSMTQDFQRSETFWFNLRAFLGESIAPRTGSRHPPQCWIAGLGIRPKIAPIRKDPRCASSVERECHQNGLQIAAAIALIRFSSSEKLLNPEGSSPCFFWEQGSSHDREKGTLSIIVPWQIERSEPDSTSTSPCNPICVQNLSSRWYESSCKFRARTFRNLRTAIGIPCFSQNNLAEGSCHVGSWGVPSRSLAPFPPYPPGSAILPHHWSKQESVPPACEE